MESRARAFRLLVLVVVFAAVCIGGWQLLARPSMEDRLFRYGIMRGRADAVAGVHRPEDMDGRPGVALEYLNESNLEQGQRSTETSDIVKQVLDAPKDLQTHYLAQFAEGYRKGYAERELRAH